jgi:RNA polymerase sigma-70 factor (ECF subfamily)
VRISATNYAESNVKSLSDYLEERRLIARFQKGDCAAFDTLYATYAARVLAFALPLVGGHRADAEDLVQETFIAAYQARNSFRANSRVLTWLLGIAHRRFRDSSRRRQPLVFSLSAGEDFPNAALPSLESRVLSEIRYLQALALLEESQRTAFVLVASQGLTHKEAAALLETPVATVKWRVAQATRHLRITLSRDEKEEAIVCALPLKTKI